MIRSSWKNFRQLTAQQKTIKIFHIATMTGLIGFNVWDEKIRIPALNRHIAYLQDFNAINLAIIRRDTSVLRINCKIDGQIRPFTFQETFGNPSNHDEYQAKVQDRTCFVSLMPSGAQ